MRFTVVWQILAQADLADIWLGSQFRKSVTEAAHRIDEQLKADPQTRGEPLHEGLRALSMPPLRVIFEVNEADRIVTVLRVRRAMSE